MRVQKKAQMGQQRFLGIVRSTPIHEEAATVKLTCRGILICYAYVAALMCPLSCLDLPSRQVCIDHAGILVGKQRSTYSKDEN